MLIRLPLLAILSALVFAGGCSTYVEEFHYAPHPAIAEIRPATTQPAEQTTPTLTAYATIIGIRRPDSSAHLPLSVEVRLRLDNHGQAAIEFDPRSMELSTGDLMPFSPAMVQPPESMSLGARQTLIVSAHFPFPPGQSHDNTNLQSLQLQWSILVDGKPISQTANFHRQRVAYYDPYWDYPYYPYPYPYWRPYWGVGGTIIIRR